MSRKFNLSFAGCGFLGLYHVGVAVCFKKYAPQLLINRISGASAGGIAACFLLCDLPISAITSDVLNLVCLARKRILGPFSPSFNIQDVLGEGLRKNLPEDAHLMVSGKLHISLTKLPGFKNVIVSKFYSKEDLVQLFKMANPDSKTALYDFRLAVIDGLIPTAEGPTPPKRVRIVPHVLLKLTKLDNRGRIQLEMHSVPHGEKIKRNLFSLQSVLRNQALLASSFVPFFSGARPAKFHGAYYMDGCFSNNLVTLDENTITVSPLCGETDICPRDPSSQLFHVNFANTSIEVSKQNIYRFASILYPPNPEVLTKLCMQGFNDALRFLETNNLIKCAQYIAVESTFLISAKYEDKEEEHDPECRDCLLKREEAQSATLPKDVKKVFQDATDATTKGLLNWIYNFRAMKILSVMMLPYTLPFEIAYSMFSKLLIMPNSFLTLCEFIMDQLEHILQIESEPTTDGVACTCTCQLTDAEYCGMGITKETLPDTSLHSKNYTAHTISAESECLEHDNIDGKNNRRLSVGLNHCEIVADDTFDNILKVTAHHESLITLYYMGDNDKIKVTEFFEVTESEAKNLMENSSLVGWLEHHEQHIQKDADNARLDISNHSEDGQVFSNPESDWTESSGDGNSADNTDYRPESDQRTKKMRKSSIIKH